MHSRDPIRRPLGAARRTLPPPPGAVILHLPLGANPRRAVVRTSAFPFSSTKKKISPEEEPEKNLPVIQRRLPGWSPILRQHPVASRVRISQRLTTRAAIFVSRLLSSIHPRRLCALSAPSSRPLSPPPTPPTQPHACAHLFPAALSASVYRFPPLGLPPPRSSFQPRPARPRACRAATDT